MSPNYVSGVGSSCPELMIIGESPGKYEDEYSKPFVGPTGQILDDLLFKAGIRRSDCYLTNVIKFRPPMNDLKKLHLINVSIEDSIKELWDNEINVLKPNCILAIGDLALQAVTGHTGILNYRGSILTARDGVIKVVPTIHPAALMNKGDSEDSGALPWVYLRLIQSDITRAAEESKSPILNLPQRELTIARNSLDLFRFFREYQHYTKVSSDIESLNCIPASIGFAFTPHHAISVPLLRQIGPHLLTDMSIGEMEECYRIVDEKLRTLDIIGHNFKYDAFKLSRSRFQIKNVISDTLIKARVLFPELPSKKLNVLTSLWTREPFYKEEGKEFKLGKSKIDQLLLYNAKDCASTLELDIAMEEDLIDLGAKHNVPLVDYYYNYMMKKHKLYLNMENVGFRVDYDKKAELARRYKEMQFTVHKRLVDRVGHEINVKSYPQMFELLYKEMKFKVRKRNPTSEDSIVALMGNHAKKAGHKEVLTDILEERRIRDQLSRYINFVSDYDGRCKTTFNISATETCRSSTGILNKPLRPKKLGLAFHTISKHGKLAKDIRSMLIADEGKVLIQADSSQAEARVVAVLSEDWELLSAFDKIDIHRRTAGLIFGLTKQLELGSDYKNVVIDNLPKDGSERFTGKKVRHAGNYNMQKGTFMREFNTDAQKFEIKMSISEWKAGQMLDAFHDASPNIRSVFHQQIKDAIDSTRTLIDPFGGVRIFYGRMDNELYKEGFANIPQRTVAHLVQGAALKINEEVDEEAYFVSENHDSLTMQVPKGNWEPYARLMKKHLETPIDFGTYCTLKRDYKLIIPCDIELSETHYGDFRKVKI